MRKKLTNKNALSKIIIHVSMCTLQKCQVLAPSTRNNIILSSNQSSDIDIINALGKHPSLL